MALQRVVSQESYDALPDQVKEHYAKDGDNYVIGVEGADPSIVEMRNKVNEFRATNIELRKGQDELKAQLAKIAEGLASQPTAAETDPPAQPVQEALNAGDNKAALDALQKQFEAHNKATEAKIEALVAENKAKDDAIRSGAAKTVLFAEAEKLGLLPGAKEMLGDLAQKHGLTKTPEGKVVFLNADGTPKPNMQGDGNLTPGEWVKSLQSNGQGFMFAASRGTGEQSSAPGASNQSNRLVALRDKAVADGSARVVTGVG